MSPRKLSPAQRPRQQQERCIQASPSVWPSKRPAKKVSEVGCDRLQPKFGGKCGEAVAAARRPNCTQQRGGNTWRHDGARRKKGQERKYKKDALCRKTRGKGSLDGKDQQGRKEIAIDRCGSAALLCAHSGRNVARRSREGNEHCSQGCRRNGRTAVQGRTSSCPPRARGKCLPRDRPPNRTAPSLGGDLAEHYCEGTAARRRHAESMAGDQGKPRQQEG